MKQRISASTLQYAFTILFFIADVIFAVAAIEAAYYLRFEIISANITRPTKENYQALAIIFTALNVYFFAMAGLYRPAFGRSRIDVAFLIIKSIPISLSILLALSFFYRDFSYSRLITITGAALACILIIVERMLLISLQRHLLGKGHGVKRMLIAGTGPGFKNIVSRMAGSPVSGYQLVGYLEESEEKILADTPLIGPIDELEQYILLNDIHVVVAILDPDHHSRIKYIVDICDKRGVDCYLAPDMVELLVGPSAVEDICGVPLIRVKGLRIRGANAFLKRVLDIVLTMIIMIFVLPVMFIISLLIRIDSPGPIFYMQKRVGMDGKIFWMYKFRTMKTDAEVTGGPGWSSENDPRVTRLGNLLRKFSIDELPQFFNVLKGDMALVGPRPERPFYVEKFEKGVPRYMERHKAKSGMTGWAQVNGLRGDTSIEERVQYDLYYLENWSVGFDLKIIILTVFDILNELRRK